MSVVRCPECGNRLKTNYCDMCMKTVPFPGLQNKSNNWQSRKYESPYEEDHDCIDFDEVEKPKRTYRKTVVTSFGNASKRKTTDQKKKKITTIAVVMAIISLVSSLSSLFEDISSDVPEPDRSVEVYNDAYVPGGQVDGLELSSVVPAQIYYTEDIAITVESSGSYYDDFAILVEVVNNTDKDITVSTNMLSVNGVMLPTSGMYIEAPEGETTQDYLTLYSYDLEEVGIKQVAYIEFGLDIWETDEYTDIDSVELIILETDVGAFVQTVDDSGVELYNDGSVRLVLKEVEVDSYADGTMKLFAENLSGNTVSISAPNFQINGEAFDVFLWNTLRSNTCSISNTYMYGLDDLGIKELSQIEEISFDLHVEYMDDWYVEQTINETIVIDMTK